jgi:hypothetical protein
MVHHNSILVSIFSKETLISLRVEALPSTDEVTKVSG